MFEFYLAVRFGIPSANKKNRFLRMDFILLSCTSTIWTVSRKSCSRADQDRKIPVQILELACKGNEI